VIWRQVERKVVAIAAQTLTFSGLAGNADEKYLLTWQAIHGTNNSWTLELNALAADLSMIYIAGAAAGVAGGPDTAFTIAPAYGDGQHSNGEIFVSCLLGARKSYHCRTSISRADFGVMQTLVYGGHWNNTADEVTSIRVNGGGAGAIKAGSVFTLYSLRSI
jgi:hypothetical protein